MDPDEQSEEVKKRGEEIRTIQKRMDEKKKCLKFEDELFAE